MSRPKGSKNKKNKLKTEVKKPDIEITRVIATEKPIVQKRFIQKILKLNKIYDENKIFYSINKYSGFISKWIPGRDKIPFDEKIYTIIDHFPNEEEYFKIIKT